MKKLLLSTLLVGCLGAARPAQAQLANLIATGLRIGVGVAMQTPAQRAAQQAAAQKAVADAEAAQTVAERDAAGPAVPATLVLHRTPADKLPKKGAEQLTALEAQLDRCHAAMLADTKAAVCTPAQRAAIQQAAIGVARAQPGFDLHPYQQEMAFYLAEDARRQGAATPTN